MGLRVRVGGHEVGGGEVLRVEDAVHRIEGELAAAVQEVGEVGLAEAGLPREERNAEGAALDSADEFEAEALVDLGNGHLWKVHHQQWRQKVAIFLEQRGTGEKSLESAEAGKATRYARSRKAERIDARETDI